VGARQVPIWGSPQCPCTSRSSPTELSGCPAGADLGQPTVPLHQPQLTH